MSTLRVNTLQDATGSNQPAMVGAAKAWVNFDGTGTVAIREQFNVSSITDNGTGDYTVNFTNAMVDANYSAVSGTYDSTWLGNFAMARPETVSTARVNGQYMHGTGVSDPRDVNQCCVAIFR